MNCKPDDLALIVRNTSGVNCIGNVIGSPVTVTVLECANAFGYGPVWRFDGALRCPNCGGHIALLLDADLQPLRPPAQETPTQIIEELTA